MINLSDYEEISKDEYYNNLKNSENDEFIFVETIDCSYYFRKKQPKQEFPIKIETEDKNIYICSDGYMEIDTKGDCLICGIYQRELEQFEEAIKKAKKVRDGK